MRTTSEGTGTSSVGASRLGPVAIGIVIALLAGIVAVGLVVERRRRSRTGTLLELGAMSEKWIAEQQSNRRLDR